MNETEQEEQYFSDDETVKHQEEFSELLVAQRQLVQRLYRVVSRNTQIGGWSTGLALCLLISSFPVGSWSGWVLLLFVGKILLLATCALAFLVFVCSHRIIPQAEPHDPLWLQVSKSKLKKQTFQQSVLQFRQHQLQSQRVITCNNRGLNLLILGCVWVGCVGFCTIQILSVGVH